MLFWLTCFLPFLTSNERSQTPTFGDGYIPPGAHTRATGIRRCCADLLLFACIKLHSNPLSTGAAPIWNIRAIHGGIFFLSRGAVLQSRSVLQLKFSAFAAAGSSARAKAASSQCWYLRVCYFFIWAGVLYFLLMFFGVPSPAPG